MSAPKVPQSYRIMVTALRAGALVVVALIGPGPYRSYRTERILRVDADGAVWLDNGMGNAPSGPFVDGETAEVCDTFQRIEAVL